VSSEGETIKVSLGTAGVLGLLQVTQTDPPTAAYLMVGERCQRDCAFCAQARSSQAQADVLSRIVWPPQNLAETVERLKAAYEQGRLRRCCLQVTAAPGHIREAERVLRLIRQASAIPLSTCAVVRSLEEIKRLLAAGADKVAIALDAAREDIYQQYKSDGWQRTREFLEQAAERFPGHLSTHLIVGLGETEEDLIRLFQHLTDHQVTIGLFAFTPVPGAALASRSAPSLASYRRVQAARYLIVNSWLRASNMVFSPQGEILGYGLAAEVLRSALSDGSAFCTAGCLDCNRPYYNERPGGAIYNYPRPLKREEIAQALAYLPFEQ
jgi:biotin synthase